MDKLKMHSPNFIDENIARLADLFPNCITETVDEDGNLERAIDFDLLRQELSDELVDGPRERYQLDWPGKKDALLAANAPIAKTLRPCREESVDFDTTENLFIEGDNLEALKLLQETYLNKVKMIYIDPPYNTGNDFIYSDNFAESADEYLLGSGQTDEEGNRLVANNESNGRFHSDWLSMMYSRLKLARNLLKDDGVIFISIDDNESSNLLKICEEVFGKDNLIASIAVQINPRGRHLDKFVAKTHEHVLVITKDFNRPTSVSGVEKPERMQKEYDRADAVGRHRLLGLRNRNQAFNPETRPNLFFPLYVNPIDGSVSTIESKHHTDKVLPITLDGVRTCWTWGREKIKNDNSLLIAERTSGSWRIYRKDYLLNAEGETAKTLVKSLWLDKEFCNDYGRKVIKRLFGTSVMTFPKSVSLIKHLLRLGCPQDGIALDFFSGSATTAHAVMDLNAEDGGNRRFIMLQLPEECDEKSEAYKAGFSTIAEISKERIRRGGTKIKEESPLTTKDLDTGFRVLKIDSSNMKDVYYTPEGVIQRDLLDQIENIKEDRTPEDLLFQVLLDWGVDLSLPIESETIDDKTVFFVDDNALAACFDDDISEAVVKKIAERLPLRAVFKDSSFKNDSVKINVKQIFKQYSPSTDLKAI